MSIIEKAAGRLAQADKTAAAPSTAEAAAPADELSAAAAQPSAAVASGRNPDAHVEQAASSQPRTTSKRVELNLAKLHEAGMVTPDGGRSGVAEEFRAIKRTLIQQALEKSADPSRPNNLIMVTSSLPGEGKTFCAINLAISIAMELDHTVLLVDADVARPSILRSLGLPAEAGLMDLLLGNKPDMGDVLLKTNVDTLSILPSGSSHRHATELLASQSMSKLLHEIANRYPDRIVIFDSPPLLLTTEARVLASQMGQIVMVVEGEKTTQNALKNALRQLESCPNLNLIYNKARAFPGKEHYGYYYY